MSNTYLNGSWDAIRYRMWETDRWRDGWYLDTRRSDTMLGHLTQIELERLVDDLQHGSGIDPIACTRHNEIPADYVRFPDRMTPADMQRFREEELQWKLARKAELEAEQAQQERDRRKVVRRRRRARRRRIVSRVW